MSPYLIDRFGGAPRHPWKVLIARRLVSETSQRFDTRPKAVLAGLRKAEATATVFMTHVCGPRFKNLARIVWGSTVLISVYDAPEIARDSIWQWIYNSVLKPAKKLKISKILSPRGWSRDESSKDGYGSSLGFECKAFDVQQGICKFHSSHFTSAHATVSLDCQSFGVGFGRAA